MPQDLMTADARERLNKLAKALVRDLCGVHHVGATYQYVADAILAAFPQLAAPSGNEAVEAARETIALWHDDGKPLTKHALTMARYILALALAPSGGAAIRAGGGK